MNIFVFLAAAALGALAFRIRGGLITDRVPGFSGQAQRAIYAVAMMSIMYFSGKFWPGGGFFDSYLLSTGFVVSLIAAWFLGVIYMGTFKAIDAGRNEGTKLKDFFLNSLRGMLYAAPAALVLFVWVLFSGHDGALLAPLMLAFGAMQGPAYEFGWRIKAKQPTVVAEFITGAFLGLGASVVCYTING